MVVNYNGGPLTVRCLRSVLASDWPRSRLRVVLVDNASDDGVAAQVRAELPDVTVVESGTNLGFGGGCNLGIRSAGPADYVALLNNDAAVDPGWLRPLTDALERDAGLGAACPKILFSGAFVEVALTSATTKRGLGDRRPLGVQVSGARVDGADAWSSVQLVRGFWGVEGGGDLTVQWSNGDGLLRVPARADRSLPSAALRLSAEGERTVTVSSGPRRVEHRVGTEPSWYEVPLGGEPVDVINNVGCTLVEDGYGADRGFLERDDGQYEQREEVFAWCGAAVLLSGRYLEDVGTFDERFFLYYEDFDLSWRGRARGWRYLYVPGPTVRHVHSASTIQDSRLHHHYSERNHLLMLARNAPASLAARAAVRHVLVTASYARRDVFRPLARGRRPQWETVRRRGGAFAAFLASVPGALGDRRRIRRGQTVGDEKLLSWIAPTPKTVVDEAPGPSAVGPTPRAGGRLPWLG